MLLGKHITVVMPAYNAELTLRQTYDDIPHDIVDRIILVDDYSRDKTALLARSLGIEEVIVHEQNRGYGANQKTCYSRALQLGTDVVVMLHPDYQYAPKLVTALAAMVACGMYDLALGSRIISEGALCGGMPLWKYISNRFLTFVENIALGLKLSEYHTGYRAYSSQLLQTIPYEKNADGFVFDNQLIVQSRAAGFRIGEISCPAKYFAEASSVSLLPSVIYGLGVMNNSLQYVLWRRGMLRPGFLAGMRTGQPASSV